MSQTGAYVDLMFAFGHARLGDETGAQELLAQATEKLSSTKQEVYWDEQYRIRDHRIGQDGLEVDVEWLPEKVEVRITPHDDPAHQLLLRGFRYRIEQAIRNNPHQGSLPADILDTMERLPGSCKLHLYIIERMQNLSHILELEPVDPYRRWKRPPEVRRESWWDRIRGLIFRRHPQGSVGADDTPASPMALSSASQTDAVPKPEGPVVAPSASRNAAVLSAGNDPFPIFVRWQMPSGDAHHRILPGTEAEATLTFDEVVARLSEGARWLESSKQWEGRSGNEFLAIARAAFTALRQCPAPTVIPALGAICSKMGRLSNSSWTTRNYYSRSHLEVVEPLIWTLIADDFSTPTDVQRRLGNAETAARRQVLSQVQEMVVRWGEPDW